MNCALEVYGQAHGQVLTLTCRRRSAVSLVWRREENSRTDRCCLLLVSLGRYRLEASTWQVTPSKHLLNDDRSKVFRQILTNKHLFSIHKEV